MKFSTVITLTFVVDVILFQLLLWFALPTRGGDGGVMFIMWPLLALWTLLFFLVVRAFNKGAQAVFLGVNTAAMLFFVLLFYPQAEPASINQKLQLISEWFISLT